MLHGALQMKEEKGAGKGQNLKNFTNLLSSPSASKRVPYHGDLWF
jgi:hypothetical protein